MATKSRLGKGLGALFPALPGDPAAQHAEEEHPVAAKDAERNADTRADNITASASVKTTSDIQAASANEAPHHHEEESKEKTTSGSASHPDDKHAQQGDEKNVSRETGKPHVSRETKGKSSRRAAMPALSEIAHPSDLFFGATVSTPAHVKSQDDAVVGTKDSDAHVSRETSDGSQAEGLKPVQGGYLAELRVDQIGPNVHQPRTIFDEDELRELADSIREVGVLQPIVVRKRPAGQVGGSGAVAKATPSDSDNPSMSETPSTIGTSDAAVDAGSRNDGRRDNAPAMSSEYELVMGERRWRASKLAGLETIPAIVKTTADDDMLRDALLENLHRVALNPLEEAAAYQQMIDEFGLTQAELSKSVSKSRPQIANTLRLLNLPAGVQKKVASGVLSAGHARALLGLSSEEDMEKLANRIIAEGLSVRSTEEIVAMQTGEGEKQKKQRAKAANPWSGSPIQQNLENRFDTKVSIKGTQKHGRIEIVFSSPEDMERILGLLMPDTGTDDSPQWV